MKELQQIIRDQKTVSTKRLEPLVKKADKERIELGEKIRRQRNANAELNKKYQQEKEKAQRRKRAMEDYENLKKKHNKLLKSIREGKHE